MASETNPSRYMHQDRNGSRYMARDRNGSRYTARDRLVVDKWPVKQIQVDTCTRTRIEV